MIDPLTQKYLEVLTEGNKSCAVKGEKNKPGNYAFEGAKKKSPNTTTKNPKISKPKEYKSGQSRKGNLEKAKVINSSVNPFEDLYNKILSEDDSFGWEIDKEESETSPFEGDSPNEMEYDSGSSDEEGENEEGGEEGGEEVTLTLDRETAEKLIDILQSAIGGTESEEEEMEDEGEEEMEDEGEEMENEGEEMEDDEELTKEEVESEVLGHSLVDQEKLLKGMNKPGNAIVRGSISAKKKKAQVPLTGKGFKGELSAHGDKGKSLQGKNNKVNAVNAGNKSFFDNK
jgi:hypothetical protein